jgi:hypothetical protein
LHSVALVEADINRLKGVIGDALRSHTDGRPPRLLSASWTGCRSSDAQNPSHHVRNDKLREDCVVVVVRATTSDQHAPSQRNAYHVNSASIFIHRGARPKRVELRRCRQHRHLILRTRRAASLGLGWRSGGDSIVRPRPRRISLDALASTSVYFRKIVFSRPFST